MESKENDVKLGQEAFVVVKPDGQIERTMVGSLYTKGCRFLNGDSDSRVHSFNFDQAAATADERLKKREVELRAALRAIGKRRKQLKSDEYKDAVMNAPYKVVDLRQIERRQRTRDLKTVVVPEQFVRPGCMVYVVITPLTRSSYECFRPHPHFVLETEVRSACFTADGKVHYTFGTPFVVVDFILNKDGAMKYLSSFSEPGTKEQVPYVSHEEEEIGNLLDYELPF